MLRFGIYLVAILFSYQSFAQVCEQQFASDPGVIPNVLTPLQTTGPFYPGQLAFTDNSVMATTTGTVSKGEFLSLEGGVYDQNGQLVKDAVVQIWQTDGRVAAANGAQQAAYNHPSDPAFHQNGIDPNFAYWGQSGQDGKYSFFTVRPQPYKASDDWMRPGHIHVAIWVGGQVKLVTQLYFTDDIYRENDLIYAGLGAEEQASVTVTTKKDGSMTHGVLNFRIHTQAVMPDQILQGLPRQRQN